MIYMEDQCIKLNGVVLPGLVKSIEVTESARIDEQEVPQPIPIVSEDASAHGIERVLFKKLTHKAENKKGQLPVTLELWEYIPQTITAKKAGSSSASSASSATSNLSAEYRRYLGSGRGNSPAKDDADASAVKKKLTLMESKLG